MLRGILEANEVVGTGSKLVPERPDGERARLTRENMPSHMHHSAATTGAPFTAVHGSNETVSTSYRIKGNTTYDMFYNDSMATGLDRNELDGVVD